MAKTLRNKFDEYLTFDKLMEAHKLSSAGKRSKKDIILFNMKKEDYIMYLLESLKNQTYKHGPYHTFYIREPKLREIKKANYIDRVVHRWVVDNFIYPTFVPCFIDTSYACIKNKGMHKAALDIKKDMRHLGNTWGDYYILKMDVRKYFYNIDKRILLKILNRKIKDKKLLWLINEILYSDVGDVGLPIGNYTSQLFANIYLNEVDQYIKRVLKIKYYYRYMDDSVLFVKTKEEAKIALANISNFLRDNLKLELNQKTQIFKSKQGINFCGYKINQYRLKIRDKGKKNFKKKIVYLTGQIKKGKMTTNEAKKYLCGHLRLYKNC